MWGHWHPHAPRRSRARSNHLAPLCVLARARPPAARNFKLLDELEQAEKPKDGRGADVSLGPAALASRSRHGRLSSRRDVRPPCAGLASRDDLFLTNWNASIVQAPVRHVFWHDRSAVRRAPPASRPPNAGVCGCLHCYTCITTCACVCTRSLPPPQGGSSEPRIWFLSLHAGDRYPEVPPTIKFSSRVTLDCVDASGNVCPWAACACVHFRELRSVRWVGGMCVQVRPDRLPYLASWDRSKSMFGALTELKALIARASRSQPPDGSSY